MKPGIDGTTRMRTFNENRGPVTKPRSLKFNGQVKYKPVEVRKTAREPGRKPRYDVTEAKSSIFLKKRE